MSTARAPRLALDEIVDPLAGLPLAAPSPPGWARTALADPAALLVDHAHCELKAASACLGLLARYPQREELTGPLTALAQEELRHFRQVVDLLPLACAHLGPAAPDRYVRHLRRSFCSQGRGVGALGDHLLVSAFIEARSCERFRLLARALAPERSPGAALPPALVRRLGGFYRRLAGAEARHWRTFVDLARGLLPAAEVERRLAEIAPMEAAIVAQLPAGPRIH